jgi:hypothetical protein
MTATNRSCSRNRPTIGGDITLETVSRGRLVMETTVSSIPRSGKSRLISVAASACTVMREYFGQSRSIVAVTTPARSGSVLSMRRSPARRVGKKLNFLDAGSHIVEDADAAFEERYGTWKDRRSTFKKPLFSRRPLGLLWGMIG